MERMYKMLENGMQMVLECWQFKMIVSAISTVFCYLFGGSEAILGVVILFVALDTLTKWGAVTKRYLKDQEQPNVGLAALICGFFYAWKPGYLTSTELRKCWGEKLVTYLILIIFAGGVTKLPEIVLFGTPVNKSITGGIYSCIALTEMLSITENLEEMGNKWVAQIKEIACVLVGKITNGAINLKEGNKDG